MWWGGGGRSPAAPLGGARTKHAVRGGGAGGDRGGDTEGDNILANPSTVSTTSAAAVNAFISANVPAPPEVGVVPRGVSKGVQRSGSGVCRARQSSVGP